MKNRKRWLSVILTLAMVFTLCITPAAAVGAGNENGATVTVEKVTGEYTTGSEVTLEVSIAGNPGFAGFTFEVIYDAGKLTLKEITQGTVTGGMFMPNPGKNTVVLANTVNLEGDGTLFTLKFTVNEAGVDGAAVRVNAVSFYNDKQAKVPVDIVAGGINDTTGGSTTGGSTTGGSTTGGGTTGGGTTGGGSTVVYKIIEGANGTWTQNSDGTLTVRANGEFSKFTGVKVDGKIVDRNNYTAKSGSTIVTLSKDYLATLSVGNHSLTVVFNDGECSTNFTVKAVGDNNPGTAVTPDNTTNNPQTGDHSGIVLAVVVLLVSGGALTVLGIAKKKAGKC